MTSTGIMLRFQLPKDIHTRIQIKFKWAQQLSAKPALHSHNVVFKFDNSKLDGLFYRDHSEENNIICVL